MEQSNDFNLSAEDFDNLAYFLEQQDEPSQSVKELLSRPDRWATSKDSTIEK